MHCVSFELSLCLVRSNIDQAEEDFLYLHSLSGQSIETVTIASRNKRVTFMILS
jgi:hypothetical protein